MSEHIKTEREIFDRMTNSSEKNKWVSLDWLKEQRKKHTPTRFLIIIDRELFDVKEG